MNEPPATALDPDRYLALTGPGAHEWWYFDAISDDGRDALVIIYYATLPFDPAYHLARERHAGAPGVHPAPDPLDHCAMGISWYRDGKTVAYALNSYRRGAFGHTAQPFAITVDANRLERDAGGGYTLSIDTPTLGPWGLVHGRITGTLRFEPAPGSTSYEHDLGTPGDPHRWILAAGDCRVEGELRLRKSRERAITFSGRGYHDHNASASDLALQMRRWHWGRVHLEDETHVYYAAERADGTRDDLWITLEGGRVAKVRNRPTFVERPGRTTPYGLRRDHSVILGDMGETLLSFERRCVDDGPFYRRALGVMQVGRTGWPIDPEGPIEVKTGVGMRELLDPGRLHTPLVRWMIPWRLKKP